MPAQRGKKKKEKKKGKMEEPTSIRDTSQIDLFPRHEFSKHQFSPRCSLHRKERETTSLAVETRSAFDFHTCFKLACKSTSTGQEARISQKSGNIQLTKGRNFCKEWKARLQNFARNKEKRRWKNTRKCPVNFPSISFFREEGGGEERKKET